MSDSTIKLVLITDVADSISELQKMLAAAPELEVVGTASTSEEGVALATTREPDVVVMDYDMPGLDGAEATRAILHEDPSIQVIMLSLVNEADDILHAMRAGARDYLVKPLAANELVETVRWLIRERREYARMTAFVKQLRKAYDALFWDEEEVDIAPGAVVSGEVRSSVQERWRRSHFAPFTSAHFYVWLVIRVGAAFLLGMLLYALVPRLFAAHLETAGALGRAFGIGFLILIATPIALFLIAITLLGIPLALVGLAVYLTALYVSGILVAALLGTQITKPEADSWRSFGIALLVGLVIVIIATAIPFLGHPIRFVVVLTGLGLIAERVRSGWRATRDVAVG